MSLGDQKSHRFFASLSMINREGLAVTWRERADQCGAMCTPAIT
jgi:hypothetical protein